jgi:RNA polymerase sigma factor (sigma-70 family)
MSTKLDFPEKRLYGGDISQSSTGFSFSETYCSLYKAMHCYGMRMLNDAFTIENVVQEAFLKLWEYRETITGMAHAGRFLRQQVRWECHAYFRHPVSKFHRRFTYLDAIEDYDTVFALCEPPDDAEQDELTERQLKAITDMMPFLPAGREKSLMKLYYIDGLSHKQIAARYNVSVSAVTLDLQKGVSTLKSMVVQPQKLFGQPAVKPALTGTGQRVWLYAIEGLNKEQSQIYRMRTELRYEFVKIADYLALPQAYVQREYVKAWKAVNCQKRKKAGQWQGRSGLHPDTAHKPLTILIA